MTKVCTKCSQALPLEAFNRERTGTHGRRGDCKRCSSRRKAGPQKLNPGGGPLVEGRCNYSRCRREGVIDGLCAPHHSSLSRCRESPLALTGGRWVPNHRGVLVWLSDSANESEVT